MSIFIWTSYKTVTNSRNSDLAQYPQPEPPRNITDAAHHTHTTRMSNLRQRSPDF